jgi:hypothetical protein
MINFNEIHRFFYDFQATLPATVCYCIIAEENPRHLLPCKVVLFLWILFYDNSTIKEKQLSLPLFHQEYSHSSIHNNQSTYSHNYIHYTPRTTDAKSWWKSVANCIKTHKRIWETYLLVLWLLCSFCCTCMYEAIQKIEEIKYDAVPYCTVLYCQLMNIITVKNVSDFPVPSRHVTNQTLPGRE